RLTGGADVGLKRLVEGPGVFAGFLTGVGDDWGFSRNEVAVNPAILHGGGLVPAPACFLGAAKTGMHNYGDELAAGDQHAGDGAENGGERVDVLQRQDAGGGVEAVWGERTQRAGVADLVADVVGPALSGGGDERFGGVDARDLGAALLQQSAQH